MARFHKQLVRVKGKNGMTPLMLCAERADSGDELDLLARLLVACPESVADVNNCNQTVVHVALLHRRTVRGCLHAGGLAHEEAPGLVRPVGQGSRRRRQHGPSRCSSIWLFRGEND